MRAARRSREGGKQWVEEEMEVRREDSKWRQAFGEAWLCKESPVEGAVEVLWENK